MYTTKDRPEANTQTNGDPKTPARSRQKINKSRYCPKAGGQVHFHRTPDDELLSHLDFLRVPARRVPSRFAVTAPIGTV